MSNLIQSLCKETGCLSLENLTSTRHSRRAYPVDDTTEKDMRHQCVVIIPAWNEEHTIGIVVQQVISLYGFPVLVVNDGSSDRTEARALEAGATVLPLAIHLETFAAIQTGFRFALDQGFEIAVTMDADGQHFPEFIPKLLRKIQTHQADMVIGVNPRRGSRLRKLAWSYFSSLSGFPFEDLTSGFKAFNRQAFELLVGINAQVFNHQDLGPLFLLRQAGLRIEETPVPMQPRLSGKSKIYPNWGHVFHYLCASTILCISKMNHSRLRKNVKTKC